MSEPHFTDSDKRFNLNRWTEMTQATLDRFIDVARVESAYSKPIEHGDQLLIPTAEVVAVMGMGFGGGSGYAAEKGKKAEDMTDDSSETGGGEGGGGGGGGNVLSRPVAVIIASPQGVRIEPIIDVTKLGLAAVTAFGFMAATFFRMVGYRRMKSMKDFKA